MVIDSTKPKKHDQICWPLTDQVMGEKDRPGWLNGERSGLQALIPSLRGTFRANAKRYYRLDLKQDRLSTKPHNEARHSRRWSDPGIGSASAQQAAKGGRPVSANKFPLSRPGSSIPKPFSADIRIIVLDSPKHMRSEGLAPPLAHAPLRPPSASKPPKAPVPTRRPLSASACGPPSPSLLPQPARPTSAKDQAHVQHWGHARSNSAPVSHIERQGGRGLLNGPSEQYPHAYQTQAQGRVPAFGPTSGYSGFGLTGESLELAAEDSIEAGPRPPSAISAVRVQVHQPSAPSPSRRHSHEGGGLRPGVLYHTQGREEDDESMPSFDQTSIQRLIEGLGLPTHSRACYQPPPPVAYNRPLSAGRNGYIRSASSTPREPRRAGSETDLRNLARPRAQTPTNSTGASMPRPSSARIIRSPQRTSAAAVPPRPRSATPAVPRPATCSPRQGDTAVSPRTSFQRKFRAGELNLLATSDAPSSQRAGPFKQDAEQWSEDGAAVVYDDDSSSTHHTDSSKEPSDPPLPPPEENTGAPGHVTVNRQTGRSEPSALSGGSKERMQPQGRAIGSRALLIVGTSAAQRASSSPLASTPSVSSAGSRSKREQVKLKEGGHQRAKTVATLTGGEKARQHSPVAALSPEMLAADAVVSAMEVVGKSSGQKPISRMASKQRGGQARRKEPEVLVSSPSKSQPPAVPSEALGFSTSTVDHVGEAEMPESAGLASEQLSRGVHGAAGDEQEAPNNKCKENGKVDRGAAGGDSTRHEEEGPHVPSFSDDGPPGISADPAGEHREAEPVIQAEGPPSNPTVAASKRIKKGHTCVPPRPPSVPMTPGVQTKAGGAELTEGNVKGDSGRGRSKLARRASSAGSKKDVAGKAARERAAHRRSSINSTEGGSEESDVMQMTTGEANVTNVRYWDSFAQTWNDEIMDSIKEDLNGVIIRRLGEYCVADTTVAVDFGCGVGRYLPHLASRCKQVYAVDISSALVDKARKLCQGDQYHHVQFEVLDVGASEWGKSAPLGERSDNVQPYPSTLLSPTCANMVICTNVVISPEPLTRRAILHNISQILCPGGFLLLLVPSAESAIMVRRRHAEWQQYRRMRKMRSLGEKEKLEETSAADERLGVFRRGGVRTKHYRAGDLEPLLRQVGLKRLSLDRVEYDWSTELCPPTAWMKGPRPWDWLVVARRSSLLSRSRTTTAPQKETAAVVEGGEGEGEPSAQEV